MSPDVDNQMIDDHSATNQPLQKETKSADIEFDDEDAASFEQQEKAKKVWKNLEFVEEVTIASDAQLKGMAITPAPMSPNKSKKRKRAQKGNAEHKTNGKKPTNSNVIGDIDTLNDTQKLQLAERANEIYHQQLKYMQDHLASLRSLIQDKENIIENLMLRYDLGIITQDTSRPYGNLGADEMEQTELRRKAEALAQSTILENFELREMVNELRDGKGSYTLIQVLSAEQDDKIQLENTGKGDDDEAKGKEASHDDVELYQKHSRIVSEWDAVSQKLQKLSESLNHGDDDEKQLAKQQADFSVDKEIETLETSYRLINQQKIRLRRMTNVYLSDLISHQNGLSVKYLFLTSMI